MLILVLYFWFRNNISIINKYHHNNITNFGIHLQLFLFVYSYHLRFNAYILYSSQPPLYLQQQGLY